MSLDIKREKTDSIDKALTDIKEYTIRDAVKNVSVKEKVFYKSEESKYTVALMDFGYKANIRRELMKRGCDVWVMPHDTDVKELEVIKPDGIMLSNGPGDPAENIEIIKNLKSICNMGIPIFGICLGHQLLALAHDFKTHKLKYGHRGANQPAKDTETGRVYITSQNHGYAVTQDSINKELADEWMINVNDKSCEGIKYKTGDFFTVQFHPEACGGPQDTAFLFDKFVAKLK